jgi:hypothetical protein
MIARNDEDSTLSLPRILCLHGGGTNARIFRAQCRVLNAQLKSKFRLCFAEAPFPSVPGPDVVSVYRDFGEFKCWLPWHANHRHLSSETVCEQIRLALDRAIRDDNQQGATGNWVGVLGFSQGAKLAASLLFQQQLHLKSSRGGTTDTERNQLSDGFFRFAVLFAGRAPLVHLEPESEIPLGLVHAAHSNHHVSDMPRFGRDGLHILHLPTIHVHGLRDPALTLHRELLDQYFDRRTARLIQWDGDHRMPIKKRDVESVVHEILAIALKTGVLLEE